MYLLILGERWKIKLVKESGGSFDWSTHKIKINKNLCDDSVFNVLIHEISEIILVALNVRYENSFSQNCNSDYLFMFNHNIFETYVSELCGVLKQLKIKLNLKKKGK